MPLFDFSCNCAEPQEVTKNVLLKLNHDKSDYPKCAKCGAPMNKELGTFNSHFKGAGFHATDYRAPTRGY